MRFETSVKQHRKCLHLLRLICILTFLTSGPSNASGAEINDLIVDASRDHMLLSIRMREVVTSDIKTAPAQDLSASVIFSIALYEVKPFWFNKKIAHHTAINTVKRHPEKNGYLLLRSWDGGPPAKVDVLNETRILMTEINNLKVMTLAGLEKGRTYQIRVRAVCQDKDAFVFSPSECFKTDWHTVDFIF